MTNLKQLLSNNYKKYPKSDIQDVFKLLYQAEFGCGHLVRNYENNFEMLKKEWENTAISEEEDLVEDIGNGYVRINISAAKRECISIDLFQRVFIKSSLKQDGIIENFLHSISEFKNICMENGYIESCHEIDNMIIKWENDNYPIFSHTEKYREEYKPAYRVVLRKYAELIPLVNEILRVNDKRIQGLLVNDKYYKNNTVIGIDGRCGSGKSTLAENLSELLDCSVIHMDDFFLPLNLRNKDRLEEAGGNIHYERFFEEVISNILDESVTVIKHGKFLCSKMIIEGTRDILKTPIIIIEGTYSLHKKYRYIYDYKIFSTVDETTQKHRIIYRNGEDMYKNFKNKWIPLEEKYFSTMKIQLHCDYVLDTASNLKRI